MDEHVRQAFERFETEVRNSLLTVRGLIIHTAEELEVGRLTETLKWNEPAYLTEQSGSGTTIRLGTRKGEPRMCALFVHCQTTLVAEFRETITDPAIQFDGNRAVCFPADNEIPEHALRHCIAQALTYKLRNRA